jgi:hypothetical protein
LGQGIGWPPRTPKGATDTTPGGTKTEQFSSDHLGQAEVLLVVILINFGQIVNVELTIDKKTALPYYNRDLFNGSYNREDQLTN